MVGPDYLFLGYETTVMEKTFQPWGSDLTPEETMELRKIYFAVNFKIVRALKYWLPNWFLYLLKKKIYELSKYVEVDKSY